MNFKKFAMEVDALAKDTREIVQKAQKEYDLADEAHKACPMKDGALVSSEYFAKAARTAANFRDAEAKLTAIRRNLPEQIEKQVKGIRAELSAAVDEHFAAKPEEIDGATLELLKSGILRPAEYQRLVNRFIDEENPTMTRMIASYAERAAMSTDSSTDAKALRLVAFNGKNAGGGVYLTNFGVLDDALTRCVRNPALWPQWESITGEVIEKGF